MNNAAAWVSIASFLSLQYLAITYAAKAKRDNAPAESKRSASAGAGARLALPVGNHGETFFPYQGQA